MFKGYLKPAAAKTNFFCLNDSCILKLMLAGLAPLLKTKFFIPPVSAEWVDRPRLLTPFAAGNFRPLTLISAPAGFGKTCLASCLRFSVKRLAWFSLEEDDNDPQRFLHYLAGALDLLPGQAAIMLQAPQPAPVKTVLDVLINALANQPEIIMLVLDDYHVIENPAIHQGLLYLLDHLPDQLRLVLTSRIDPPLNLARLRAQGKLLEIRAADLRFNLAETGQFLNQVSHLGLSPENIAQLHNRTEGWPAGLRLAALALQHEEDKTGFIRSFSASHRFLTDYLLDEVLSRQEPEVCQFLLRTSFLQRFCASLCDAVLETDNSLERLRFLEQANLFLVPLDHERHWFRYHALFAQFLQLRLREAGPDLLKDLARRAMAWCGSQGQGREALVYALQAGEMQHAAELVENLGPEILNSEGAGPVVQWLEALPPALVCERPRLGLLAAWTQIFSGQMPQAEKSLELVELLAAGETRLLGEVSAHRAYIAFLKGDYQNTIRFAQQALTDLPEQESILRARTAALLGHGLRFAGNLEEALESYALSSTLCQRTGQVTSLNFTLAGLAQVYRERGQLHAMYNTYQRALAFARDQAGRPDIPVSGFAYVGLGMVEREWNDLEAASQSLETGLRLCRELQQADTLVIALMEQAFLCCDLRDYTQARQVLEEALSIVSAAGSEWGIKMVKAYQALVDLASGEIAAAVRWAETSGLSPEGEVYYESSDVLLVYARVLMAQGRYDQASGLFERIYRMFQLAGRNGRAMEMMGWQALALFQAGRPDQAYQVLKQALAWGEPENYQRSFINGGQTLAAVLRQLPASAYRDRLLAAIGDPPLARPAAQRVETELFEALNERELEVLRLLAAGRSNQEIGEALYLSVNTIRWYAVQIYAKLGVKNRAEAAARGRQLGLL